jgi:hypothetical protein
MSSPATPPVTAHSIIQGLLTSLESDAFAAGQTPLETALNAIVAAKGDPATATQQLAALPVLYALSPATILPEAIMQGAQTGLALLAYYKAKLAAPAPAAEPETPPAAS